MASTKYPVRVFNFPPKESRPRIAECRNQIHVNWRFHSRIPTPQSDVNSERAVYESMADYSFDGKLIDYDFAFWLKNAGQIGACLFYQDFSAPITSTFARLNYEGDDILSIVARRTPKLHLKLFSHVSQPPVTWMWLTFALAVIPVRTDAPDETKVWGKPDDMEDYLFMIADRYGVQK